jgi:hypothetical protein
VRSHALMKTIHDLFNVTFVRLPDALVVGHSQAPIPQLTHNHWDRVYALNLQRAISHLRQRALWYAGAV